MAINSTTDAVIFRATAKKWLQFLLNSWTPFGNWLNSSRNTWNSMNDIYWQFTITSTAVSSEPLLATVRKTEKISGLDSSYFVLFFLWVNYFFLIVFLIINFYLFRVVERTYSLWAFLSSHRSEYINPLFDKKTTNGVMDVNVSPQIIRSEDWIHLKEQFFQT